MGEWLTFDRNRLLGDEFAQTSTRDVWREIKVFTDLSNGQWLFRQKGEDAAFRAAAARACCSGMMADGSRLFPQRLFSAITGGAGCDQVGVVVGAPFTDRPVVIDFEHDIRGELSTVATGEVVPLQDFVSLGVPAVGVVIAHG